MSLWWLLILWPVSGLLSWAWLNHMLSSWLGPDDSSIGLKTFCAVFEVVCGPIALLAAYRAMYDIPQKHRRGLRFR